MATPDLTKVIPVTEDRRLELLALARISRIQWVVETANTTLSSSDKNVLPILAKNENVAQNIPISSAIQEVLSYFTKVIGDNEYVSVNSLIPISCYDEFEVENDSDVIPEYNPNVDPFVQFIDKLRRPLATEIVKTMQLYLLKCKVIPINTATNSHTNNPFNKIENHQNSVNNKNITPTTVFQFLSTLYSMMRQNPLWCNETKIQYEITMEMCEKFISMKLYYTCFGADIEDESKDLQLHSRIASLQFLSPEHLDIRLLMNKTENEWLPLLQPCIHHLLEIDGKHCPNDKMLSIKKWGMSIALVIKELKEKESNHKTRSTSSITNSNSGHSQPPGADEFLSLLILTLQRSNPPRLYSTQKYLQQ